MGAPSKELWGMLILCVPIIIWQTWIFSQANAPSFYLIIVFEVAFVGGASYLVWRYGGITEAVTKVLEFTRVWDRPEPTTPQPANHTATLSPSRSEIPSPTAICVRCGYSMTATAKFCRRCGARQE